MNFRFLFFLGSVLLFIGLFWMLLPHAYHNEIISEIDEDAREVSHYLHLLEGLIPTILGLTLMILNENKLKDKYINSKSLKK